MQPSREANCHDWPGPMLHVSVFTRSPDFVGRAELSRQPTWRSLFLSYLSHPSGERRLYREAVRRRPRTLLELGIGSGIRAARLIEIASWWTPGCELEYTGIDLFESRQDSDGPGMTLKGAYQALRATGARVRLLPGTAEGTLFSIVGAIRPLDFVVASNEHDLASLADAVRFFPKVLNPDTRLFVNTSGPESPVFRHVPAEEIREQATAHASTVRRAA